MLVCYLSGFSIRFQKLSRAHGQVTYVLLTRSPLDSGKQALLPLVRLACIRHAASVHPEPGSNSQNKFFEFISPTIYLRYRFRYIRCSNKFDYLLRLSLSEYLAWFVSFNSIN